MGKFVISKRTNGEFQFNLKANNGQFMGSSKMYESVAARENKISFVKNNAPEAVIEDTTN